MTEFVVQKEEIKVVISDKESYMLTTPNKKRAREIKEEVAATDVAAIFDLVEGYLEEFGLPKEAQDEHFSVKELLRLWETVCGGGRKN